MPLAPSALSCHSGFFGGGGIFLLPGDSAAVVPCGGLVPGVAVSASVNGTLWGACPLCRPPTLPLVCCFAPYPPNPLPRRGRGRFFCFLMQGASPLASPALNRLRHLQSLPLWCPEGACPRRHWLDLPIRHSTGACLRHRQFAAKPTETLSYEQCRQPRRGGTGGEELRRLRWSSPPGQGEQVPRGGKPPCPPPGTQTAGIASAAGVQARGRREPPAYPPIPPFFAPPLDKTQAYVYNVD